MALWQSRISEASEADSKENYIEELTEFGWWLPQAPFEKSWTMARLEETLDLTNGAIDLDYEVVKKLTEYVEEFPARSVRCLTKIVKAEKPGFGFFMWKDDCRVILEKAKGSSDLDARGLADDLVNYFGSKQIHDFRDLLG